MITSSNTCATTREKVHQDEKNVDPFGVRMNKTFLVLARLVGLLRQIPPDSLILGVVQAPSVSQRSLSS